MTFYRVETVRLDRDTTAVTLTKEGRDLLESSRRDVDSPDRQTFNHGVQKPRELKTTPRSADRHSPIRAWRPGLRRSGSDTERFPSLLERHSAVLRALPAWTVRVVVPPQFSDLAQRVKQAFFTQLAMPALSPEDIAARALTVETIDEPDQDREAAVAGLKAGIASMRFFSEGPLPSREELHDRR